MDNEKYKDKVLGSLIGGAIGDALGYQIEFKRNIKEKEITKYNDNNGIGLISDDTQMTLFTTNALLSRDTRALMRGIAMPYDKAIYFGYLDWLSTQMNYETELDMCMIKYNPDLCHKRAPGNTCISALLSGKMGTIEEPINDSKGCGSIMRVAPIGLYMPSSSLAGMIAAKAGAITHGHPLGIIPCYVFGAIVNILSHEDLDVKTALEKALELYSNKFDIYDNSYKKSFLDLMNKAIELSEKNIPDALAISKIGEGWIADEALAIALYSCLKYQNSFEDAVICAVNHDGDSDSTGSIAGNIIGAYLGFNKIDKYYIDNLELKDLIIEIGTDLSSEIPVGEDRAYKGIPDNQEWLNKYSIRFKSKE